jgi:hypothetical protein
VQGGQGRGGGGRIAPGAPAQLVGLIEDDDVRALHLFDEQVDDGAQGAALAQVGAGGQRGPGRVIPDKGGGVDDGDERVQADAGRERVARCDRVGKLVANVLGFGDAAVFQDDAVVRPAPGVRQGQELLKGAEQLVLDGAAWKGKKREEEREMRW